MVNHIQEEIKMHFAACREINAAEVALYCVLLQKMCYTLALSLRGIIFTFVWFSVQLMQ